MVEKIVFRSDKGFSILACSLNPYSSLYRPELEDILLKNIKPNSYNNFAVTINMMDAHEKAEGKQYIFAGEFIKHKRYGEQFAATFYYIDTPHTDDGMLAYLQSLPNIGPVRSAQMIKKFGVAEITRILDEEPNKISEEISGISENRVPPIKQAWDRDKSLRELYIWLNAHGITPALGRKIYSTWGIESFNILTHDPFRLTEIKGIGFIRADEVAHKIFKDVPKDIRSRACLRHLLDENLYKNSNLCMPYVALKDLAMKTLKDGSEQNAPSQKFEEEEYKKIIPQCIKKNLDIFVAVKNLHEPNNGAYVYLKSIWEKEKYIASQIYHRSKPESEEQKNSAENNRDADEEQFSCSDKDMEDAEKDVNDFSHRPIVLDDCQKQAIKSAFENKMTVITGSGGSGKSTICRCVYHLSHEKDLRDRKSVV